MSAQAKFRLEQKRQEWEDARHAFGELVSRLGHKDPLVSKARKELSEKRAEYDSMTALLGKGVVQVTRPEQCPSTVDCSLRKEGATCPIWHFYGSCNKTLPPTKGVKK